MFYEVSPDFSTYIPASSMVIQLSPLKTASLFCFLAAFEKSIIMGVINEINTRTARLFLTPKDSQFFANSYFAKDYVYIQKGASGSGSVLNLSAGRQFNSSCLVVV